MAPRRGGHRPKRSLGQNFLVDPNLQRKIVEAVGAGASEEVVEVGPGRGALTRHLAGRVGHLVLVELDDDLAGALREEYQGDPRVDVRHADVLQTDLASCTRDWAATRVVGNIPYNITTPILFHLLERPRPRDIVLMVQREVAERIVAQAGTSAYGALAVGVQSVADADLLFRVPPQAFRPVPRVESAVVRVTPHRPPGLTTEDERRLRRLTRAAFHWRRKQMQKILRDHPDLAIPRSVVEAAGAELGLDLARRPETFAPDLLVQLAGRLL
ncbi:MAG: 16S rRNA (adenine(1518)-N(6)/adenine(1519)-N(6))-dimethyltransferase RsmA [Gemmatimonadota bacterium]